MRERRIARWCGEVCKTCGAYTHSCKCEHENAGMLDMLFKEQPNVAGQVDRKDEFGSEQARSAPRELQPVPAAPSVKEKK